MRALTAPARRVRGRGAVAALIVAAAVGAFGGAQAASAHDSLVSSTPSADETVSTASEVALTFSANLLGADGGNEVIVVGPDARHYETDCTALAGPTLTTPVQLGPAGEYQVTWRAVSSDGHPVSGTYAFAYAPAAGAQAAPGADTSPCASVAASQESTGTEDAAASTGAPSGLVIGLSVGGVAVIAVGVVVALLLRPRRQDESTDE